MMENLSERLVADLKAHGITASISDDGMFLECLIPGTMKIISRSPFDGITGLLQDHSYDEIFNALYQRIMEASNQFKSLTPDRFDLDQLETYDEVKNDLIIRPLNCDTHADQIKHGVYWKTGDVALVLYRLIKDSDESLLTHMVLQDELKERNIPEEKYNDVLTNALRNTSEKFPAVIYSLKQEAPVKLLDTDLIASQILASDVAGLISSTRGTNGAAALFYPGVLQKLVNAFGPFKAVFMNTSDVMIYPEGFSRETMEIFQKFGSKDNEFGESLSKMIFDCSLDGIRPESV